MEREATTEEVRVFTPWLGFERVWVEDLPACCARSARAGRGSFECPGCGAIWKEVEPDG